MSVAPHSVSVSLVSDKVNFIPFSEDAGALLTPPVTIGSSPPGLSGFNNFLAWALVRTAEKAFLWSLLTTSLASAATSEADFMGQSSTGLDRNSGPFCHTEFSPSSSGEHPLVTRSAMLTSPGIHHQSVTGPAFWISPTRFAKNVWNP